MDKTQPLWMPRGSVRSILALALVAAAIQQALTGHDLSGQFGALVVAAVSFYFGHRDSPQPVTTPEPTPEPEVGVAA